MAKHTFQDLDNVMPPVEPGDYTFEIIDAEFGIVASSGNEKADLKLQIDGHGSQCYDTITFTPKAAWKIDTLLKSCGVKAEKGQTFEINSNLLIGLRGWATLGKELVMKRQPDGTLVETENYRNKVVRYITNGAKIPRRPITAHVPVPAPAATQRPPARPAPMPQPPPVASPEDDDLPF